jgi:hypothetical protein
MKRPECGLPECGTSIMTMLQLMQLCQLKFLAKDSTFVLPQSPYSPNLSALDFFSVSETKNDSQRRKISNSGGHHQECCK